MHPVSVVPFKMHVVLSDGEKLSTSSSSLCGTSRPTAKEADTNDECAAFRSLAIRKLHVTERNDNKAINRLYGSRRGTLGFQLVWWQRSC